MKAATPLPREGAPSDVAKAAVFLTSDNTTWVTGVPLPFDGGFLSH
jgi:meso-butanediol dehydrogenase/(S,S)-butanediol dehydrogenase/diacetyl reductase